MKVWEKSLATLEKQIDFTYQDIQTKLDREKLTASLGKGTGDLSFLQAIGKGAGEATGSVDQKRKQIEEQIRRIDQTLAMKVPKTGFLGFGEKEAGSPEGRQRLETNKKALEAQLTQLDENTTLTDLAQKAITSRPDLATEINQVLRPFEIKQQAVSQQKITQRESLRVKIATDQEGAKNDFENNPQGFIQSAIQAYPALTAAEIKAELKLLGFSFEE